MGIQIGISLIFVLINWLRPHRPWLYAIFIRFFFKEWFLDPRLSAIFSFVCVFAIFYFAECQPIGLDYWTLNLENASLRWVFLSFIGIYLVSVPSTQKFALTPVAVYGINFEGFVFIDKIPLGDSEYCWSVPW